MTEAHEEPLARAVLHVLERLMTAADGVRPGISHEDVPEAARGAAHYLDRYVFPLAATPYAPPAAGSGAVPGTVEFATNELVGMVDEVRVVLLAGDFDVDALGERVVTGAAELGVTLTPDDDEPHTWWEPEFRGRDLWISFGEGVVVMEGSRTDF